MYVFVLYIIYKYIHYIFIYMYAFRRSKPWSSVVFSISSRPEGLMLEKGRCVTNRSPPWHVEVSRMEEQTPRATMIKVLWFRVQDRTRVTASACAERICSGQSSQISQHYYHTGDAIKQIKQAHAVFNNLHFAGFWTQRFPGTCSRGFKMDGRKQSQWH